MSDIYILYMLLDNRNDFPITRIESSHCWRCNEKLVLGHNSITHGISIATMVNTYKNDMSKDFHQNCIDANIFVLNKQKNIAVNFHTQSLIESLDSIRVSN